MRPIQTIPLAALTFLALAFTAIEAAATEARATVSLNVRAGPSTAYTVVDTLTPGERVEIQECRENGWCFIRHPGPDGWVSARYLTAPSEAGSPGSDCSFRLVIGPDGPRFSVECGDGGGGGGGVGPVPATHRACFFDGPNYTGERFCRPAGTRIDHLTGFANDRITSVRLHGNAKVRLCVDPNMGGFCRVLTSNENRLGFALNNRASSLRVFTGTIAPPPPPTPPSAPVTHSTGAVDLPLTRRVNLDNGTIGPGGADLWYRPIGPMERRLVPVNGARMARGDGSNRGYDGCRSASYSPAALPRAALPVGTYVCVRTSAGRISQFRVNGYGGGEMRLGYTTWAH